MRLSGSVKLRCALGVGGPSSSRGAHRLVLRGVGFHLRAVERAETSSSRGEEDHARAAMSMGQPEERYRSSGAAQWDGRGVEASRDTDRVNWATAAVQRA